MLNLLWETTGRIAMDLMEVSEQIDEHIGATHTPLRFKPGKKQYLLKPQPNAYGKRQCQFHECAGWGE